MKSSTLKFVFVKEFNTDNDKFTTKVYEAEINRRESLVMLRTEDNDTGLFNETVTLVELGAKFLGLDPTPQYNKETGFTEN